MARKMASIGMSVILLTAWAATASAIWPFNKESPAVFNHEGVTVLDNDSFEPHVIKEDDRFYLVKYYAPWCRHCKTLAPVWGQLAADNTDSNQEFVQVDCDKNKQTCDKAAVHGFPSVKMFYNGRIGATLRGSKDLAGMKEWIVRNKKNMLEKSRKTLEAEAAGILETDVQEITGSGSGSIEL